MEKLDYCASNVVNTFTTQFQYVRREEEFSPLRFREEPNIELRGSWDLPMTLQWLPAPGIPGEGEMGDVSMCTTSFLLPAGLQTLLIWAAAAALDLQYWLAALIIWPQEVRSLRLLRLLSPAHTARTTCRMTGWPQTRTRASPSGCSYCRSPAVEGRSTPYWA